VFIERSNINLKYFGNTNGLKFGNVCQGICRNSHEQCISNVCMCLRIYINDVIYYIKGYVRQRKLIMHFNIAT